MPCSNASRIKTIQQHWGGKIKGMRQQKGESASVAVTHVPVQSLCLYQGSVNKLMDNT
jgi:hypothetical protein